MGSLWISQGSFGYNKSLASDFHNDACMRQLLIGHEPFQSVSLPMANAFVPAKLWLLSCQPDTYFLNNFGQALIAHVYSVLQGIQGMRYPGTNASVIEHLRRFV